MFEVGTVLLATAIALIAYSFFKWATLNNDFFEKRGVRFLKPTFLLGSTWKFYTQQIDMFQFVNYLYRSFPNEK